MSQVTDEIDKRAAVWAARVAGGDLTPDEEACFETWRAADIRHIGAFARAQAILLRLDRLRAVGAGALRASIPEMPATLTDTSAATLSVTAPETPLNSAGQLTDKSGAAVHDMPPASTGSPKWTRRRMMLNGSAAASVAAAGIVGAAMIWNDRSRTSVAAPPVEYFSTRMGETRSVRLADGSVVTLNTRSKISVNYTESARNIRLDQGEALFKVAKNKKRPFIVTASDTVVRAVGTSFTVRLLPQRPVQILVQEGVVEVAHKGVRGSKPIRATAETQAVVAANAPIIVRVVPHPQVERNLAWRYGQISFENETLADAAEEFARYGNTKIAVDPAIAKRTITGMYASNDPVGFARAAASVLELHVEVESNEVWIVR
jgi:transmembrane sensor